MSNEDKTVFVVFNGEIYNYREIRRNLQNKGHHFISNSDTEVIVHLYEEEGESCFELLDGMYAIAIWDSRRRRLLLARDRFGEKPLYYLMTSDGIIFASEIKSLVKVPLFRKELRWESLEQFLTLGYILAPFTPYQNVYKLLPGHHLIFELESGNCKIQQYWEMPRFTSQISCSLEEEKYYIRTFQNLFLHSVQSRLISDVPVGAFLSGGIDSSLTVIAMSRLIGDRVKTFSIGSRYERSKNENPIAHRVAQNLNVEHYSLWCEPADVIRILEKLPWLCDEPSGDPALISVYLITEFARDQGIKVMLSGDGGDELFLGYPTYRLVEYIGALYRLPSFWRHVLANGMGVANKLWQNSRIEKASSILKASSLLQAVYMLNSYGAWSVEELDRLLSGTTIFTVEQPKFTSIFKEVNQSLMLREAYFLIATYLPDNNLSRMDRASMANAVETRAPFLHPHIAEFSAKLPLKMKIRRNVLKYISRQALREFGGQEFESIASMPKHGFDALPMAAWLRGELKFLIDRYLDPVSLRRQGIFRAEVVEEIVQQHLKGGRFNHWWKLWLLIVLQIWMDHWA